MRPLLCPCLGRCQILHTKTSMQGAQSSRLVDRVDSLPETKLLYKPAPVIGAKHTKTTTLPGRKRKKEKSTTLPRGLLGHSLPPLRMFLRKQATSNLPLSAWPCKEKTERKWLISHAQDHDGVTNAASAREIALQEPPPERPNDAHYPPAAESYSTPSMASPEPSPRSSDVGATPSVIHF
jgi:hypothetical protein